MGRSSRRDRPTRSRSRKRAGRRLEWIGGRLSPPFFIHDREEPYRAELAIWVEASSGLIVGQEAIAPEDVDGAVGRVLLDALERPLAGPARQPDEIRVADASLAAEVRAAAGDSIPVAVAPTPELDALLEVMLESMPTDDEPSYLEGGRLAPSAVSELFVVAKLLYGLAPWKTATEDQVLRLDVPELDVEGACVSIIGRLGESLGLLIFPSIAGWTAFARAAGEPHVPNRRPNLGSTLLSLCYESAGDLPASMRREAMSHGWPVFDAAAYPRLEHRDADGAVRPLTERDVKLATACATSLCTFFIKHGHRFAAEHLEPVSESYFDDDDLEVRFTLPYEAFPLFEVETGGATVSAPSPEEQRQRRVGRNDPCPCGSGRKYKKCHLPLDEAAASGQAARDATADLDNRLVANLSRFAMARFGSKWRRFTQDFDDASDVLQLAIPWSVFHYRVDGATVLDWYRREKGPRLSHAEDAWLEAQRAAWLSVWEVTDVKPGAGLTLRDLLTGETRDVSDVTASQAAVVRDAILGRVVDHEGVSLLRGVHPLTLPPLEAAEVVRRARGRLRRKRAVPVDRVRDEAIARYLIRRWEEAVAELDARHEVPPQLTNTDGDPILFTTDHFDIAPGAAAAVQTRLAELEGVEAPDADEDPPVYVFLRPERATRSSGEVTVVGEARLTETALRLDTNSRRRADALRKRLEAACGEWIRHRAREHADPLSRKAGRGEGEPAPELDSPEAAEIALEFKRRHYADWVDHPLPALGGKTPRQAIRSKQGRDDVDLLLRDMENMEQRSAGGAAFDFSELRRMLGLAP